MAAPRVDVRPPTGRRTPRSELEAVPQELVEGGDAVVVEAAGNRAEDRQFVRREAGVFAVAGQLPAHLPEGVLAAPALELVDGHGSGEVEHVDLLQLGGGAELRRHHVEGEVDMGDHGGVPLADARRLHDDEVEAGGLAGRDGLVETGGQLGPRAPGGEGAEIDAAAHRRRRRHRRAAPAAGVRRSQARCRWSSCGCGPRAAPRLPCGGSGPPPARPRAACPPGRPGTGAPARQ